MFRMNIIFQVASKLKCSNLIKRCITYKCGAQLDDNTLMKRFLLYLDKQRNIEMPLSTEKLNILQVTSSFNSEMETIKGNLNSVLFSSGKQKVEEMILFDKKCCTLLQTMDTTTIFSILNVYMQFVPYSILEYQFYIDAMNLLKENLQFLTVAELIQFMFFIALQKNTKEAQIVINKCLKILNPQNIEDLNLTELCIICNATFKTSTKINKTALLRKIINVINNDLTILNDPAVFITLVKTLRHNRFQDAEFLETIACTILFNSTYRHYSFSAICHILALFCDVTYYDEPLLKLLCNISLKLLEESVVMPKYKRHYIDAVRPKDITRFLFAHSTIGHELPSDTYSNIIVPKILDRMKAGDYDQKPEQMLDSIFFMWMANYQALELIPYCFSENNIKIIRDTQKSKDRLNLLLTCMQIENLPLFKQLNVKPKTFTYFAMNHQISVRPQLRRVHESLKNITHETNIKFELECQIPHLKIVGLTGYKRNIYKAIFIEVLDEYVCIKNKDNQENGLMKLKLRLLDTMDQAHLVIESSDIEDMKENELQEYLKSEIDLVC